MGKWNYGISCAEVTPMTAPLPLEGDLYDCMEKAASYGYQGVEFHTRESYKFDLEKIKSIGETSGAKICCIASGRLYTQGGHGLLDENAESEKAAISGMHQYIDMASDIGADVVIGWAKGTVPPQGDRKIYLDRLAENLRKLDAYAGQKGTRLLLEVINHYETNIFNMAEETLAFIEKHRLENCYIHLDTYHMNMEEFNPYQAIRICGRKLGYFHVADNSRRYPGSGQLDFKRVFETLDEMGYDGWVTVECLLYPDRDTAAQKAICYLKACEQAKYSEK
ncbi:MAG: sugar phosphate isomerase/epimerase [Clostridiales bacterium]|nr:sugar phosphate isomerase/epimerase [Clostridiales bacterium]